MYKITPEIKSQLQLFASNMPVVMEQTQEFHYLTGKELKEMEIYKDDQDKDLIDEKQYRWAFPVQIAANHYRRLKNAYQRYGEKGIIDYINKIGDLKDAQAA